ncbi:Antirestriction protein ArdC [Tistlia consotensis]|uniref:Antirestriction protein ArdC n=1 Tax=Tistlia consotensis USBA 355 TaxID=560819 RepID=A0A1Y6CGU5_9PROT|nr:zincin-like metallopeptidase domain-containing protein [Tistlia consotensis]SMF52385.1 Antirestriction protein ArdC [Tistlia consotensis USBA 355]SNR82972.1 Antirestriction protein ArdC [Tistlia consotensis]
MPRPIASTRPDLYARVTDKIIEDLERGVRTWTKPWSARHAAGPVGRPLRHNLQRYSGINVVLLWSEAVTRGYTAPIWMTFRQAAELGGRVRKGETGSTVVYANRFTRTETDDNGQDVERQIPFLKAYTVFNVEQIDGLPSHFSQPETPQLDLARQIGHADAFFAAAGADVRQGGDSAYYAIEPDYLQMPRFESFVDPESYYATLAHEMTHWTRHPSRLDRDLGRKRWGDEGYAREELVAELGAAFLCADLGLELQPREDHAAYIGSWLDVLKNDKRFVFSAAAHAQRAVDFLHRLQPSGQVRAA